MSKKKAEEKFTDALEVSIEKIYGAIINIHNAQKKHEFLDKYGKSTMIVSEGTGLSLKDYIDKLTSSGSPSDRNLATATKLDFDDCPPRRQRLL